MMKSILLSTLCLFFVASAGFAQCGAGEIALTMSITVDPWGQETYWEIVPTGNGCGNGTIAFGSNSAVGCAGTPPVADGGYLDNSTVTEGPVCLVNGDTYDFVFVDSYGDGGLAFELYEDGSFSHQYVGSGLGNTWTFIAGNSGLPVNDSPCGALQVIPDGATVEMNNLGAVVQAAEPHPAGGGCGTPGLWCDGDISNTIWAYFIAEENVAYEITSCNEGGPGFDTQIALYHASDCADFSTFELVNSNDDMQGGCPLAEGYSSLFQASCLIPGDTYYIQVDGWGGAIGIAHLSVTTYTGATSLQAQVNNINCPLDKSQVPNGAIFPYIIGASADYTSSWTGPNNFSSTDNYISNLAPGTYSLTAISTCGTSYNADFIISQPEGWNVNTASVGPDCTGSGDGNIALTVAGGTAPYEYTWVGPNNFLSTSEDISALDEGAYQVEITDANGCTWNQTYQLAALNAFSFDLGNDTVICIYDEMVVSAPPGLTYLWQDGSTNQFFIIHGEDWDLGAHALILVAETAEGCSHSDAFLFSIDACAGVHEGEMDALAIYPNPASNHVQINFPVTKNLTDVKIMDASGRLVKQAQFRNGNQMDISIELASGVYSMDVISDNEHWNRKIVIQH